MPALLRMKCDTELKYTYITFNKNNEIARMARRCVFLESKKCPITRAFHRRVSFEPVVPVTCGPIKNIKHFHVPVLH